MSIAEADATSANLRPGEDLLEVYRRTGAAEDFERVVTRYAPLVYGECRRVTRDAHDAEDAAQLAFLALAIELRSGGEIKRPAGWLQRVAKRHALKIVRSRGRRKRREDAVRRNEMLPTDQGPLDPAARDATAGLIREAIDALPEKHRLPLVLHYFGGMTLEAIARELGMTRTAVGTRLHRARKQLGDRLAERGLVFDAGELSAIVGVLVPATVIATLHRAAHAASAGAAMGASPATFATSVGQMLVVAANMTSARPIAAATAALLCIATSSGLAWVGPTTLTDKLNLRPMQLRQWLNRLLDFKPRFSVSDAFGSLAGNELPEGESTLDLPGSVAALPDYEPNYDHWIGHAFDARDVLVTTSSPSHALPEPVVFARPTATPMPAAPAAPAAPVAQPRAAAVRGQTHLARSEPSTPSENAWAAAAIHAAHAAKPQPRPADAIEPPSADAAVGTREHPSLAIASDDHLKFGTLTVDGSSGGGGGVGGGGAVLQRGGRVDAGHLIVGNRGNARYDMIDGRIDARRVTLGAQPGSRGVLSLAGELNLTDPSQGLVVGEHGDGTLLMGSGRAPGRITTAGGPIVVRAHREGRGKIRGWGEITSPGGLTNNGQVIADGSGESRSLDLSGIHHVDNTIDNKPDGSNGWYARNGGKLVFPTIRLRPGINTYTVGESASDATLDLVNSIRFTTVGQRTAGSIRVALHPSTDNGFQISLPNNVSVVGLWSFVGSDFDPNSLSFQVRFDHLAVGGILSESKTNLIAYHAGGWQDAGNLSVDASDHIVSGSFSGSIQYLAVGYPLDYRANLGQVQIARPAGQFITTPTVSPEPATVAGILSAAALLAPRRRRPI